MLGVVCGSILMLLSIVGLVEVFRMIVLLMLRTKDDSTLLIIVPIAGHNEKAEILLRSAAARVRWLGAMGKQEVICLDLQMDEETKKVCSVISEEYGFIRIYSPEEFEDVLSKRK